MATSNSFARLILDWANLLAAYLDNAESLKSAEVQRAALAGILDRTRELKNLQESHTASRQQVTQELKEMIKEGREAARRLRGAVKANLGTKSERLVQFNVAPLRPRGPRQLKAKAPEAVTPTA